MNKKHRTINVFFCLLIIFFTGNIFAQDDLSINTGADIVSRYVWRGIEFGNAPSIQPALSVGISGIELGVWGAYALSNNASASDELDAWISYTHQFENSSSISFIITDYYFPNAGKRMGNFNDYDDEAGAGAHLFEAGLIFTGCKNLPLTISAYYNFYNDAGNNTYFEVAYPVNVKGVALNLFAGATAGSTDNTAYYGAEEFSFINIGCTASREIKISNEFSLPVFVSYSLNPKLEKSYLVFGISL